MVDRITSVHNIFLFLLSETGLITTIIFFIYLFYYFKIFYSKKDIYSKYALLLMTIFFINSQWYMGTFGPNLMILFFSFLSLILNIQNEDKEGSIGKVEKSSDHYT